ncbi:glycoside hydrolase family 5 protein, partial [Mixia osmundae IAM 14324]|uniref:glycoside hydrolase family 5 protein n=1 Tax=Mixia osmundae (strain CBS 9802 / IAM 14324 / JCM 22182 / KY 12970) TaxID=764103 RepID=UPI0004A5467B
AVQTFDTITSVPGASCDARAIKILPSPIQGLTFANTSAKPLVSGVWSVVDAPWGGKAIEGPIKGCKAADIGIYAANLADPFSLTSFDYGVTTAQDQIYVQSIQAGTTEDKPAYTVRLGDESSGKLVPGVKYHFDPTKYITDPLFADVQHIRIFSVKKEPFHIILDNLEYDIVYRSPHSRQDYTMHVRHALPIAALCYAIKTTHAFQYGKDIVRGVSLGGWLVLEPWITPSIFDKTGNESVVDEWTLGQFFGGQAQEVLKSHWDTFITEADFEQIASYGLNHVRIPIGAWAFDISENQPYAQGQLPYLQQAVYWAKKHGINVLIDLHGASVESQNGQDNSGRRGDITWGRGDSLQKTEAIIQQLLAEFTLPKYGGAVTAIEVLNEPRGADVVLQPYRQYLSDLHPSFFDASGSRMEFVYSDAFQPVSMWNGDYTTPGAGTMDTHIYSMFADDLNGLSDDARVQIYCSYNASLSDASSHHPVIVGEFTAASSDCAAYLNGRGRGARFDGTLPGGTRRGSCTDRTGSASRFSDDYKHSLARFWQAQVETYESSASGWIHWTWRSEGNSDDWDYSAGVEHGWIPKDPTQRLVSQQCNSV